MFITSTTRELSPVVKVDDRVVGSGKPGPVTKQLLGLYQQRAQELTRGNCTFRLKAETTGLAYVASAFRRNSALGGSFWYASIGGHAQIRFRSPYGLSMRDTDGQTLFARTHGSG